MTAAKHFGKVLHQKNPLPVEGDQKIKQELGQEARSTKHMLLLNNLQKFFRCIPQKMNLKRKKHLSTF
jgi:hypothetical protein